MSFFTRALHGILAFFTSPSVEAVEKEVVVVALPLAEKAVAGLAATNPAVSILVQIAEPVIASELNKGK